MTLCLLSGLNSPESASSKPITFLANSMTAVCIPRQMPRYGTLFSLANCAARIFPSMPRFPKPPGTSMPSAFLSVSFTLSFVNVSLSVQRILIFAPHQ